jgi:hypothetical protein
MIPSLRMRWHALGAGAAALALRLLFIWKFAFNDSGDTRFYEELARNWLAYGVYGLRFAGQLVPVDIRMPGYPAFLALVYRLFGSHETPVMVSQAILDVIACFVIAVLAARLAPEGLRRRAAIAGLWLAALCPFTANYTATVLTEVLATFLTALALLPLLSEAPTCNRWTRVGFLVGLGALVRPEAPLIAIAATLVLMARRWRPQDWPKLARDFILMAVGLVLPLLPWAARNWHTLHEVQFLTPRYTQLPGEYVPRGLGAWTATWLWRFRDVYSVPWKLDEEQIRIEDIPSYAFDSPEERARVAALLALYNETTTMTPPVDRDFAEIARERTARQPLRTYVLVPIERAAALWFTPRVEMLPSSGRLWPLSEQWEDDPGGYCLTLGFTLLGFLYVGMAIAGGWIARRQPGVAFLVAFILVRTAFLTTVDTPEPRYVLECFPAVLALAAQVFVCRTIPSGAGENALAAGAERH